jgi:hypothetical protein
VAASAERHRAPGHPPHAAAGSARLREQGLEVDVKPVKELRSVDGHGAYLQDIGKRYNPTLIDALFELLDEGKESWTGPSASPTRRDP